MYFSKPFAPLILAIALAATGCSRGDKPAAAASATWAKYGLTFQYPVSWQIGDEMDRGDGMEIVTVTIENAGTWDASLVMLQTFEPALPATFDVLAAQYLDAMPEALEDSGMADAKAVDEQPVTYTILNKERAGKRVRLRGQVAGQDHEIVTEFHVIELANRTLVLQTQAPVTDLKAADAGFAMVRKSLALQP